MATVVPSAARTTSGSTAKLPIPVLTESGRLVPIRSLCLIVNTTAASGTGPTLTLSVEWSVDGTNFAAGDPADAFAPITAVAGGKLAKAFAVKAPFYRIVWTIAGTTPSLTFSVDDFATI